MNKIYKKARAKINLNLLILDKRPDNYHNLKSVFQKINLYDELFVEKIKDDQIIIDSNINDIFLEDNIIYKAYNKIKEEYDLTSGVKVKLIKNIPMQAGLGGGSTDCAAFLYCINKLFDLKISKTKLESIGKSLGADVVPCFYNKAILVEGIGDIITKIDTNFKYYIVLVKPEVSNNTKIMYQKLDECEDKLNIDNTDQILKTLENNDFNLFKNNLYNSFECVIESKDIKVVKEKLMKNGAIANLMSGSGSSVFGIFENKELAIKAYKILNKDFKTYICTSFNSKMEE